MGRPRYPVRMACRSIRRCADSDLFAARRNLPRFRDPASRAPPDRLTGCQCDYWRRCLRACRRPGRPRSSLHRTSRTGYVAKAQHRRPFGPIPPQERLAITKDRLWQAFAAFVEPDDTIAIDYGTAQAVAQLHCLSGPGR